ncbi:protein claret segregational-like [Photinus pyralis]|nr:protein claret segregational-like [Photinus pyralis]XP_031339318.1 protein claret segregational-like [Photinus pyralis]XP_031339319.1 protein claret segregational-like [Photinus pyralis]
MERTRIPVSANKTVTQRPARGGLSRRSNSCMDLRNYGTTPHTTPLSNWNAQSTSKINEIARRQVSVKPTLKSVPQRGATTASTVKVGSKRPAPPVSAPTNAKVSRPPKIPAYDYKARFNSLLEKHKVVQQASQDKDAALAAAQSQCEKLTENEKILESALDQSRRWDLEKVAKLNELNSTVAALQQIVLEKDAAFADVQGQCEKLAEQNKKLQSDLDQLNQDATEKAEKLSQLNYIVSTLEQTGREKDAALAAAHCTCEKLTEKTNELLSDLEQSKRVGVDNELKIKELTATVCALEQDLLKTRETNLAQEKLIEFYGTTIQEHEDVRRIMHNQIQDLKGTIRVFCRVRPPLPSEEEKPLYSIAYVDEATLEIRKTKDLTHNTSSKTTDAPLEFVFDKVFEPEASQTEVFTELSQLIQSAMDGYHVCVFAYGQTGSGKTYTMQGGDCSSPGIIPQTVDLIFKLIAKYEKIGWCYTVQASFLEIYNETIRDLLNIHNKEQLEIRFNEGRGTTVTNLTTKPVHSPQELHTLISYATQNRAVAVTNYNEHSSRSHVVAKITLSGVHLDSIYSGSVSLVDLAGSESAKTTCSERMAETKNINKSLSALGSVMNALQNKDSHIPYRNTKLTYLLQSSLGGNSKTLMFVNIAPFQECYGESINALRFASKVKEVKLMMKKNKTTIKN